MFAHSQTTYYRIRVMHILTLINKNLGSSPSIQKFLQILSLFLKNSTGCPKKISSLGK